ncbi:hypothetical protein HJC23_000027 [Cyclotella cryptica]|uniref:RNase H type-1 domain-containing protein n=1 Tax=Cyclotella cryptica TaxID=29204 RepID=A0ABD3P0Q1_9STRA
MPEDPQHRYLSDQSDAATSSTNNEIIYILRFGSHIDKHTKDTGIGIAIYNAADGKNIWTGRRFIPVFSRHGGEKITNNLADYLALADGLKIINTLRSTQTSSSSCRVEVQTSNGVIAKHLNKDFKVASESLKPWYERVTKLMDMFDHASAGCILSSECADVKKASELAVKEQKSSDSYLIAMGEMKSEKQDIMQPEENKIQDYDEPVHVTTQISEKESPSNESNSNAVSPDKVYILRFDGGSRGNPGIAGSGMALYDSEDGSEIWSGCQYLGNQRTNNEAEYMGLITGLQCALSLGVKKIVVQGDSMLVLQQIELKWKVKSPTLKHYFEEAISLKKQFAYFQTSHIERAKNSRADELANEAMDTMCSRGFDS